MTENKVSNVPHMERLRTAAKATGLSYRYLLSLCHEGKIANIRCGRDYRINMDALITMLNGTGSSGEAQEGSSLDQNGG